MKSKLFKIIEILKFVTETLRQMTKRDKLFHTEPMLTSALIQVFYDFIRLNTALGRAL